VRSQRQVWGSFTDLGLKEKLYLGAILQNACSRRTSSRGCVER
jgi:hypothetical protein